LPSPSRLVMPRLCAQRSVRRLRRLAKPCMRTSWGGSGGGVGAGSRAHPPAGQTREDACIFWDSVAALGHASSRAARTQRVGGSASPGPSPPPETPQLHGTAGGGPRRGCGLWVKAGGRGARGCGFKLHRFNSFRVSG
jgi:hypothetical protein